MGLHINGILVFLLLLLPNIIYVLFPPLSVPNNLSPAPIIFTVIEQIGRITCFILPLVFGKKIAQQKISYLVILMGICLLVYYICWISYLINGREYYELFKPLGFIPIPMAVFPLIYLILLGVWLESPIFIAPALLFTIGHITVSWNTYIQIK